ncbi:MAG: hypothetical protein HY556_12095 [Euryarchaeota archaeon]|nr:hypothetical protein [Euryarchaeota archaeon]
MGDAPIVVSAGVVTVPDEGFARRTADDLEALMILTHQPPLNVAGKHKAKCKKWYLVENRESKMLSAYIYSGPVSMGTALGDNARHW